ncbi:MAG: hypothetical protein U0836_20565 [Pirellulales bacterium]
MTATKRLADTTAAGLQRLITIETDGTITTLCPRLTPCQAEAVYGFLKALMPDFYIDAMPDNERPLRVLPLSRKAAGQ